MTRQWFKQLAEKVIVNLPPTRAPVPIRLQQHWYLSGNNTRRSELQMVDLVYTSFALP
jgi:hypothetical protein